MRSLLWLPGRLLRPAALLWRRLYDGAWFNGPFYYRDYGGRRQFWTHGGWHDGRYRGGRFGPALGRNFYAKRGFGGRGFNRGGNWGGRGGQNFAGRGFNGGGINRGFAGRSNFQAQPQARQNFGFQGRGNWGGWNRQNFQSGGGGWQGRGQAQAQAPAAPGVPGRRRRPNWGGGGGGQ